MPNDGYLEIGCTTEGQVSMIYPNMPRCEKGGYILFTPSEARHLSSLLIQKAEQAESLLRIKARPDNNRRRRRR